MKLCKQGPELSLLTISLKGNMTSISCAGVFVSSWFGGLLLQLADWIIKKLPLIKHIYSAAKQVCCTHLCRKQHPRQTPVSSCL